MDEFGGRITFVNRRLLYYTKSINSKTNSLLNLVIKQLNIRCLYEIKISTLKKMDLFGVWASC